MIVQYATKPDINGNVYRLKIDHDKKTYTTNIFFHRSDAVTITYKKYKQLINAAREAGYIEE